MPCLELKSLTLQIGNKTVCRELNLKIEPHERWALLGKNGIGKTTLLHSLLALHQPNAGDILINGKDLKTIKRQALAKQVGILFQEGIAAMPSTVLESVLLGRHPHTHSLLLDDPRDLAIANEALRSFDLEMFADRQVDSLSGGEKQRLALATLVTQSPSIFLLDEPSNHLDLAFQVKLLNLLDTKLKTEPACVLMATHDINLAARFCNKFVLLGNDGKALIGNRDDVLTEDALSDAFECAMRVIAVDDIKLYVPSLSGQIP